LAVYRKVAADIIDADGVLLKDGRILISISMRPAMLALLHEGHLGMEKLKAFARQTFWWPGLARDVEATVSSCAASCALHHKQPAKTLMPHEVPVYPWQKIGVDIFTCNRRDYLLVVDYFSKFPLVVALPDKSASSVVNILKSLYAIYGVPMVVFGDNQPFHSRADQSFAET
jgi:hypothetical protein